MDTSLIFFVLVVAVGAGILLGSTNKKGQRGRYKNQGQSFQYDLDDDDALQGFPYEIQRNFLSPAELSFFHNLRDVVGNRAVVLTKVGLGDVFWIKLEDKSKFRGYRNKIDRKHVDFLLCDSATMRPLMGIELDDSSHQRPDRQSRDIFVDGVFAAAKLPLLHVPVKRAYVTADIEAQLAPYLRVSPMPTKAVSTHESPRCHKCGSEMILRTAKTGANAGNQFWVCSGYPTCQGMVALSPQSA